MPLPLLRRYRVAAAIAYGNTLYLFLLDRFEIYCCRVAVASMETPLNSVGVVQH